MVRANCPRWIIPEYQALFFYVAKLGWFVVQPLVAILLLAALGLIVIWLGRRRFGQFLVVLALVVLAVFSLSPLGLVMTAALEDRFPRPQLPERVAGIVVLGGAFDTRIARTRGQAELNDAADRVTEALILSRRYPEAKVIFSGGDASILAEDVPETLSARNFFLGAGLEPGRLILDGKARDTFENAVYARELAEPKPGETWLLITSAFHMPRAVGCFRQAGFEVLPYPVDYRTPAGAEMLRPSTTSIRNLEKVHFAIREYLGLLAYRLKGRTDALFPAPKAGEGTPIPEGSGSPASGTAD
ncbi:YdcF family protein [Jiella pacifica]|uniref:YdcF family protein n=1 Tax=Jiella pacifica TaxID=2696469 RepID=UPI001FE79067|nr:YdcF family protein [Jiella pacifica]